MIQIKIVNNKITSILDTNRQLDGYIQVPNTFSGTTGMYIEEFNEDWTTKTLQERFELGFYTPPKGYKVENNEQRELTQFEKYKEGIDEIPIGFKLGETDLVELTKEEKIEKGLLTQKDVDIQLMGEYQSYVNNTDWYVVRKMERNIEIPSEVSTKRVEAIEEINRIRDLYNLKKQEDY